MISYDHVLFLREKLPMYLPSGWKDVGGKWHGRCPFCGDSRKNAWKARGWVYMNTDCSYYCFNCGISMSGIKLLEALAGADYDAIKKEYVKLFLKSGLSSHLSSFTTVPKDEPTVFEMNRIVDPSWKHKLSKDAHDYLKNRKVLDAPFLREDLFSYFAKNGEEYIMIPWVVNGVDAYYQLNDFKKLHSLKYIFPKDKKKLLYGLDNIDPCWPFIICFEGVFDSLFVKNGIATGTKAITEYQVRLIKERFPRHTICISFDNDESGMMSMVKMIRRDDDFKFFKWFRPETEEKDINDYILAHTNINAFASSKKLETMIVDSLQMKMWLIEHGHWPTATESKDNDQIYVSDLRSKKAFLI